MLFFALMLKVHGRQLDKPDWYCVQGGLVVVGNSCAQNVNVFLYFYSTIEAAVGCKSTGRRGKGSSLIPNVTV